MQVIRVDEGPVETFLVSWLPNILFPSSTAFDYPFIQLIDEKTTEPSV